MDSDTDDNPNIEEIIHNEPIMEGGFSAEDEYYKSIMEGGFDDYYSDEDGASDEESGSMDGGATPKYSHINPSSSSLLLSHKYDARIYSDGSITVAPRDLLYLAARINPLHEINLLNYAFGNIKNTNDYYKGFFSLYYKTMYHLRTLIIEVSNQLNNPISKFDFSFNNNMDAQYKASEQFRNSHYVKSSKYTDSIYKTGYLDLGEGRAKYLTQLCSKSRGSGDDMGKETFTKSGNRFFKRKSSVSKTMRPKQFVSNIETVFESINSAQNIGGQENNLKCMLYYIRYHQVAFNYYLEQLIIYYRIIIEKTNNIIFNDGRAEEIEAIKSLLNGEREYRLLLNNFNKLVTDDQEQTLQQENNIFNDDIALNISSQQPSKIFTDIMNEINNKSKQQSNIIKENKVINEYIYLFIYFTYKTKYFIIDPNFFSIKAGKLESLSEKRSQTLGKLSTKFSTNMRTAILASAIPYCMKILLNSLHKYKTYINNFSEMCGINHLSNIKPDMHSIKSVFSRLTDKNTIKYLNKKESKVVDFIINPYKQQKDESTQYNAHKNKIIFASYVVDCLIMKLFANQIYDGKQDDIEESLKSIYNRLLSSNSINPKKIPGLANKTIIELQKVLEGLLKNNIDGIKQEMATDAYTLFTEEGTDRKENINNCFAKLYEYAIELLLNTPIIIYRYEKLSEIRKFLTLVAQPRRGGFLTSWLRDHPNINKDIASMSRDAIKTFTNLIVGIELGIYDFEKNITFTKNSESVYSSLPLYFENLFRSAIYSATTTGTATSGSTTAITSSPTSISSEQPKYLLSSKMYDFTPLGKLDSIRGKNLTSIEASTLSLEELINIWYAKEYEMFRVLEPALIKGGADTQGDNKSGASDNKSGANTQSGDSNLVDSGNVNEQMADLANLFGSTQPQTGGFAKKQTDISAKILEYHNRKKKTQTNIEGFAKKISTKLLEVKNPTSDIKKLYGDKTSNDNRIKEVKDYVVGSIFKKNGIGPTDMFSYLQELLQKIKEEQMLNNSTDKAEIDKLPNGDTELANVLLTKNFSYLYDMAFINETEQDTDSDGIKLTRNLLIKTIHKKIEFMKARLKQLMLDTPDIDSNSNIYTYRKIYKITLSKAMILVKMKQYVDDISKIITTGKIITASSSLNTDENIAKKYTKDYFNNFLANLALNNAKIAIKLSGGSDGTLYNLRVDKDNNVYVSPDDLKRLFKLIDPTFKMIVEKKYDDLSDEQQLYKLEDFKAIKAIINNIKDTISFKSGGGEPLFPRIGKDNDGNNTSFKFSGKLISDANALAAGDNPIKTALSHFWSADAANPKAMQAAKDADASSVSDDSDGTHKWHFALQSNIAKIKAYFIGAESVFTKKETAAIDPVLMYKINMLVLQKYNEAMKYCIDNFLMMADNGNGFIDGNENENVPEKFAVVLGELVKILNRLARGDNNEAAIDGVDKIIVFKADDVKAGEFQKTLCKQLSEYYLMVSVIRCIEYMFQVLTKCNEALINTEFVINASYVELREDITKGDYQKDITTKLGEIMTDANGAAKQASEKAEEESETAKKASEKAKDAYTTASQAYTVANDAYNGAINGINVDEVIKGVGKAIQDAENVDLSDANSVKYAADDAKNAIDADAVKNVNTINTEDLENDVDVVETVVNAVNFAGGSTVGGSPKGDGKGDEPPEPVVVGDAAADAVVVVGDAAADAVVVVGDAAADAAVGDADAAAVGAVPIPVPAAPEALEAAKQALGDAIKELKDKKQELENKQQAIQGLQARLQAVETAVQELKKEAEEAIVNAESINAVQAIIDDGKNDNTTLKGLVAIAAGGIDGADYGNVSGKIITDVEHAKTQLQLAIDILFSAIVTKMNTENTNNIKNAKDYAITIKKVLFDIVTAVDNSDGSINNTKDAFTAGYGVVKTANDNNLINSDPVKTALNECLYVAVAIAGLRMKVANADLFAQGDNYGKVEIVQDANAPDADADLGNFTLAVMQNIVKYISFKIENEIDTKVFTELGAVVKTTAKGFVDGNLSNKGAIDKAINENIKVEKAPIAHGFIKYPVTNIFGPITDDATKASANTVDFIEAIVNAILELDEIKSKVQQPKIQNMMQDGLMRNVLQFTRYIYPSTVNDDGQRMITLLTDDKNELDTTVAGVKPVDEVDLLFNKYREMFSKYIKGLISRELNTIYDRFNMVFMVNYVVSDVDFVKSLKMTGEKKILAGTKYNLEGGVEILNHPNIGLVIEIDYDTGYIVNNVYLPIDFSAKDDKLPEGIPLNEGSTLPTGTQKPKANIKLELQAEEYAKKNNMLWIESGDNNGYSCWINSAIAALLADKRIINLPDTYYNSSSTDEYMFTNDAQTAIINILKKFIDDNTEKQWTKEKYKELLDYINKYFKDNPDKLNTGKYKDVDQKEPASIKNIYERNIEFGKEYSDALPIMVMLLNVLQKGRYINSNILEFIPIFGNSIELKNLAPGAKNNRFGTEIINPDKQYKLLSVIVPTMCSNNGNNISHFRSYAKIDTGDSNNELNNYWVRTDLAYNKPSKIVSTEEFNRVLKCSGKNIYKTVYAIYIHYSGYKSINIPAVSGGGLQLTSSKTKKNSKKRATLTGKRKAVRNHSNYNNMYKGAKKSLMGNAKNNNKNNHRSPKTKKAAKRYIKTGKRA